jgi:tRNA(adenine34) deaminase
MDESAEPVNANGLYGGKHTRFMKIALKEAEIALAEEEIPVGAVIVSGDEIVAKAHNQKELLRDPSAHAEMLAITQASAALDRWRLTDTTLYITLEPCAMCAGAIVQARIPLVVFGAFDDKAGAAGSLMNLLADIRLNHQPEVISGFMAEESRQLMLAFFQKMREKPLRRGG